MGKREGKISLGIPSIRWEDNIKMQGIPSIRWEDNIKMHLQEVGWSMYCTDLAQDRDSLRSFVMR